MIIDASVAFKLLVDEPGTDRAMRWLADHDLNAPFLILNEVANGLWKRVQRGELDASEGLIRHIDALTGMVRIAGQDWSHRALEMALELSHPVYDCVYLAMAEASNDRLLTADEKFVRRVSTTSFSTLMEAL